MRTFDEIMSDIDAATSVADLKSKFILAGELSALGTPEAEAAACRTRAIVHRRRGEYNEALEQNKRSMEIYERLGDRQRAAQIVVNLGNVYVEIGDYPLGLEHFTRALSTLEELGEKNGVANALANLGMVYSYLGDYPTSLEYYTRSLLIDEEIGNHYGVALVTLSIGTVYSNTGDHAQALDYSQRALTMLRELGNEHLVSVALGNMGNCYDALGDHQAALDSYHQAIDNRRANDDLRGAAHVMGNLVHTYLTLGQDDEASELLDEQSTLSIVDPSIRVVHHSNRAILAEHRGDLETAHAELQFSLSLATETGRRAEIATCHQQLRDLAQKRNDFAGYIEHNNEFTRLTEEVRGKQTTQRMAALESDRRMQAERAEREKERALLYGALPESVAKRMLRGESVTGDHYDNASVIFLDIVGFTSISDRIPSGHVVHLLEQIFSSLDSVCKRHDVVKIKTIGDSYMAVSFGTANSEERTANTGHIHSAAACALDMIASLDTLVITMPPALGDTSWTKDIGDIKVRIGIHCGPVTAGVIGTQRMQYDVWGDTVNVASRMESTSEPGKIQISEAFASLLPATSSGDSVERPVQVVERGTIEVKGKGMMKTYWLE